jgi:hypothetical protein
VKVCALRPASGLVPLGYSLFSYCLCHLRCFSTFECLARSSVLVFPALLVLLVVSMRNGDIVSSSGSRRNGRIRVFEIAQLPRRVRQVSGGSQRTLYGGGSRRRPWKS